MGLVALTLAQLYRLFVEESHPRLLFRSLSVHLWVEEMTPLASEGAEQALVAAAELDEAELPAETAGLPLAVVPSAVAGSG